MARRARGWRRETSHIVQDVDADPVRELRALGDRANLAIVLSNHFVRYAVLPWSSALKTEAEWAAYAQHAFVSIYGSDAANWQISLDRRSLGKSRVASAIDATLLGSLQEVAGVVSVRPYLVSAFNARRRVFDGEAAWFVLQEPGRVTLALIADSEWKLVRTRQTHGDWRDALSDLIDRERELAGAADCQRAFVYAEDEPPAQAGRYQITDITLPAGVTRELRGHAMAFN
jgi:hypothetical protein